MKHFLLIHGSWHGAWCWFKIVPRLSAHGTVAAVNLPGRGRDPAAAHTVDLDTMVAAAERHLPAEGRTTIVVHSRYGIVASVLAERHPDRIERVIYLASFMLPDGDSVAKWGQTDTASLILPNMDINMTELWDWLRPEAYREALYADCGEDDVALANALLCREPMRPAGEKLVLTGGRYGLVPRAYIRLTEDMAVSLDLQDRLIEASPPDRVESIAASHSAYFSQPDKLTETIVSLARV
ncbi:MAG: alpha/beta fold hydrolase [Rhizobiaceae bacterium]|nr:alpha/beta fold hydrolase [Rhizobiaceae bacterium]